MSALARLERFGENEPFLKNEDPAEMFTQQIILNDALDFDLQN